MIRTILFTSALALAAPAMAQQSVEPGQDMMQPQQQGATPAAPASPQTASPEAATPTQANPTNAVATIVDTEFPAYDTNGDGQLDKPEFSKWMVALKDQEMKATGATLPAEQVTAWASGAFTTADADKSTAVSKPELVTFLSGTAA